MTELKKLLAILEALVVGRFYGSVLVRFEAGRVTVLEKKETIKL